MGEVKRYYCTENCGSAYMVEFGHGEDSFITHDGGTLYVSQEDYDTLRAEVERLRDFIAHKAGPLIAAKLAQMDGYDPTDQHGGLYDLRWSGGPQPEPEGDAWSMDYLPRGEKIAADLAEACGRKG